MSEDRPLRATWLEIIHEWRERRAARRRLWENTPPTKRWDELSKYRD